MKRKRLSVFLSAILMTGVLLSGCSSGGETAAVVQETAEEIVSGLELIDMAAWQYDADDGVYYQIGISYCETPADVNYETMGIFVPAAYFDGTDNGDGTYTCTINASAQVNGYTAATAPMVIPVETPGYAAMSPPTDYTDVTDYTDEGFVYLYAGCRGRDAGAPAGVTDLKAAIRYTRYNAALLPGDTDRIFSFGMSGGGAQSALLGATGNSELYTSYLEMIGAVQGVSDAVAGSMCWCPITNLEQGDEAYEWMMGTTRSDLSDEEKAISEALVAAFADQINAMEIADASGQTLVLVAGDDGRYQSGSYYDYIKGVIEGSLNNFLVDTTFPYDASSSGGMSGFGGGPRGGFGGRGGEGGFPGGDGGKLDFEAGEGMPQGGDGLTMPDQKMDGKTDFTQIDDIARTEAVSGVSISGTYETAQDYIDALNANGEWVIYDEATNTASITSIASFAEAVKPASKSLGAFDQFDGGQGENTLFGYGDGAGAHFDPILAEILEVQGSSYAADYAADLVRTDAAGNTVDIRLNAYSPLCYLLPSGVWYGEADVAKYWRIRTGCWQSDTSVTTEANLALALEQYSGVESVDFATVWGMKHVQAERTGDSTSNFIQWVEDCTR